MLKHRIRKVAVGALVAVAAATLVQVSSAAPASAAVCTRRPSATHDDGNGGVYHAFWVGDSVCPNAANAPIYSAYGFVEGDSPRIGTMLSTRSWFLCWVRGAPHAGGNNVWYYTQGDVALPGWESYHAWGYMPARYVFTTNDPGDSRLPACPPL